MLVLYSVLILCFFVQLYFMLQIFLRAAVHDYPDAPYNHGGISLVIAARNEAAHLQQHLPLWLDQQHARYEVIIVNDGSDDDTRQVLDEASTRYPALRVIHLETHSGKKQALTAGIQTASYPFILLSDADCKPAGRFWAAEMASHCTENKDLVLGYGSYARKKGLLNQLVQYETLTTAARYMGYALRGKPYMGVGRNLLFRKSAWEKAGGYEKQSALPYGDDDLLVQQIAGRQNTALCLHPRAFTISTPPESFNAWFRQKKRHLSAGHFYRRDILWRLGSEQLSAWLFLLSGLLLVILGEGLVFLFTYTFYTIYKGFIYNRLGRRFETPVNIVLIPVLDTFYLLSLLLLTITSIFTPTKRWG